MCEHADQEERNGTRTTPSPRDGIRDTILAAFGDCTGLATIDLPNGDIGVIDLDDSHVFLVSIREARFEVVDGA